jgi:hypothetical protein
MRGVEVTEFSSSVSNGNGVKMQSDLKGGISQHCKRHLIQSCFCMMK